MIEKVVTTVYKIEIQGEPFNLTEEELRKLVTEGMKALGIKEQTGLSIEDLKKAFDKPPLPKVPIVPEIPITPFPPQRPRRPYPYEDDYVDPWNPNGRYPYAMPPEIID